MLLYVGYLFSSSGRPLMGMRGRHANPQFKHWRPPGEVTPKPISPEAIRIFKRMRQHEREFGPWAIDGGNGIANWLVVLDYLREWLFMKTRHGDRPSFSKRRSTDFFYWNGRRPRNRNLNTSGKSEGCAASR